MVSTDAHLTTPAATDTVQPTVTFADSDQLPPSGAGAGFVPASTASQTAPTPTTTSLATQRLLKALGVRSLIFSAIMLALMMAAYAFNTIDTWLFSRSAGEALSIRGLLGALSLPSESFIALFLFPWLIGLVLIAWYTWLHREEPDGVLPAGLSKEQLRKSIQKRYRGKFWISFGLLTAAVALAIVAFIVLKDSRIWYGDDPFFSFLATLKNMFPYVIVAAWLGGTIILLFSQWRQSASDIVALVDSIEQMQTGTEGSRIEVPGNLPELGPVLQDMFDESCKDKRVAREAEQRKNDLILYLAHDLKTPLTSVIGYLNLLNDSRELTDAQKEEFARIAWEKSLRLEDLIEQFFEISRFSLYDIELERSAFSLNLLLMQLVDEFYPLLQEQGREVALEIDGTIEITGDAGRLARVFNNLFRNAIAYSHPGSTIYIRAYCRGNEACISFINSGDDISEQQLGQIFEKFFRLDEARATESGGAGLGLAIAREIVTKHGGMIQATSSGGETVFTVVLPRVAV